MVNKKSSFFQVVSKNIFPVLFSLALFLQQSFSQQIKFGHCSYSYDSDNIYSCELANVSVISQQDILNIIGDHLPGHSDSNVIKIFTRTSTIRYFNGEIMKKFENLQYLDLSGTGLRNISSNAFDSCKNLNELKLVDCQLLYLPQQVFGECVNLKLFDITRNVLLEVPSDIFGMTSELEVFNVAGNRLSSLPDNLLQNMRNLKVFNASGNSLERLGPNLLKNSTNLEVFDISSNVLLPRRYFNDIFNGHSNLRKLRLVYIFNEFDFGLLTQFQNLEELSIRTLFTLETIAWQSLPSSLKKLEVFNIGEELPENAFVRLANLTNLSFGGVGIERLYPNSFATLTKLESLSITFTKIQILYPDQFASQSNLHSLDLTANFIIDLPEGIFAPLMMLGSFNKLTGLILHGNKIQKLNINSFGVHPHLRQLNFRLNRIEKIERGLFRRFQNLSFVDLTDNICVSREFIIVNNLEEHKDLEWCYNNWDGISTTTTPQPTATDGVGQVWRKLEIIFMIIVGCTLATFN